MSNDEEWKNRLLSDVDPEGPSGGPVLWLVVMCAIGIMIGVVVAVLAMLA